MVSDAPASATEGTTVISNDWRNNLPKEVQDWQEAKQSDSPEKFWDQMTNMRKFIGQSIRIPSQDAGQETMNEFYNKLQARVPGLMPTPNPEDPESIERVMRAMGKPEKSEAYSYDGEVTESELNDLRRLAADVGMTKRQFKKFADGILGANKAQRDAQQNVIAQNQASLKKEWGAALDERMQDVLNIAEATGANEQLINSIKEKTIDAHTAKWLYQLGKQLGGEAINAHIQEKTMAPDEARESIDDIMNNPHHPYWITSHPDHERAVKKVVELHRLSAAG